jgi:hypothetical protein
MLWSRCTRLPAYTIVIDIFLIKQEIRPPKASNLKSEFPVVECSKHLTSSTTACHLAGPTQQRKDLIFSYNGQVILGGYLVRTSLDSNPTFTKPFQGGNLKIKNTRRLTEMRLLYWKTKSCCSFQREERCKRISNIPNILADVIRLRQYGDLKMESHSALQWLPRLH